MSDHKPVVEFDAEKIDRIFADVDQCRLPGVAVGIAVNGVPVYHRGFGLASMELPVVLSPSIRMRIFSITKHFAALGYLLLSEEGAAGLDDPVGEFLPELHPAARRATMRQLMGHVSGLRDAKDICLRFCGTGHPVSSADLLSYYYDIDDTNAAPGTTWNYNNGGYLMVTLAIERITGQPFEEVLRRRIFQPVGMNDTLVRRWDTDFVPNSATLHTIDGAGDYGRSTLGIASAGEGGIVSTIDDMLRWLAHMDDPVVGTATTWAIMTSPQRLANGTGTGYGLGLMVGRYRGARTVHHSGGGIGGNSQLLKVPEAGLDIVILANRSDISAVERSYRVLDACLPGLDPLPDTSTRPPVTGTYRSPTTGRVVQLLAQGAQQIALIDGTETPVVPDGDGVLWPAGALGFLKQGLTLRDDPADPDGPPTAIRLNDFGNVDELAAAEPPPADRPTLDAITGGYRSTVTGTDATITGTDHGLRLRTVGRFGATEYELRCLAPDVWRATNDSPIPMDGILTFDRHDGFRFSSARTRDLFFQRRA